MREKHTIRLILVLISFFALSTTFFGCVGGVEPRNIAMTNSALYDLDENGIYHVILEIIDPSNSGDGRGAQDTANKRTSIIRNGEGITLTQAVTSVADKVDKTLFGTHNRVRFITERMAKNENAMNEFIDFVIRNDEFDERPWLFIINHTEIIKLFNTSVGLHSLLGEYVDGVIRTRKNNSGYGVYVETLKYIIDSMDDGVEAVLGRITLVDSQKPNQDENYEINFDGLAAFKNNKFVGYLDQNAALAYNIINGYLKKTRLTIEEENFSVAVELSNTSTEIKTHVKDGNLTIDVDIKGKIKITELLKSAKIKNTTNIKFDIEGAFEKALNSIIEKSLLTARDGINSDIYGFGRRIKIIGSAEFNRILAYQNYYSLLEFNRMNIDLQVTNLGDFDMFFN
ncbi:MAG: Ger(x)C family spore germination protein [Christensenellaceae bacterium]|nr:Ger(x)C family spore germination protein [Christensenellaceae bacterium]